MNFDDIEVLDVINLGAIDHNCNLMYDRLEKLKKDYYSPNEKIFVLHNESEFFYYNNPLGFTTHNFFSCWRDLDIPYHVMVMYTISSNIKSAITPFIVDDRDQPTVITTILNNHSYLGLKTLLDAKPNKNIIYPSMCLLGRPRAHRIKIFQYLAKNNLFNQVKTNFSAQSYQTREYNDIVLNMNPGDHRPGLSNAIYTYPHRNNELCFKQSNYKEIIELSQYQVFEREDEALQGPMQTFYNNMFLDIVVESVFDYPHSFITEKTLRPILLKTPFILFGSFHTLKFLRSKGFKTFRDFWNEDYDNEPDSHLRFLKCCSTMHNIVTKPIKELNDMYLEMNSIIEYNYQRFFEYVDTEFKPLYRKIGYDPN